MGFDWHTSIGDSTHVFVWIRGYFPVNFMA
jgi:hypothetical protein